MKRLIMEDLLGWRGEKARKPLIIRGVRQCGKTYILKEFGRQYFSRCHYFNFEITPQLSKIFDSDLVPARILNELSFLAGQPIDIENELLIFDEIQACPNALTSLKYFQEAYKQLYLCAAGSLLGIHLGPVSFPVGKVTLMTLHPMNFEEFLMADGDERSLEVMCNLKLNGAISEIIHEHLWGQLKRYFVVGGMPEAVAAYCERKSTLIEAFKKAREIQSQLSLVLCHRCIDG